MTVHDRAKSMTSDHASSRVRKRQLKLLTAMPGAPRHQHGRPPPNKRRSQAGSTTAARSRGADERTQQFSGAASRGGRRSRHLSDPLAGRELRRRGRDLGG
jgi:hypothetical protein